MEEFGFHGRNICVIADGVHTNTAYEYLVEVSVAVKGQ